MVEELGSISGTYFCDDDRDGVDDGAANGDSDVAGLLVSLLDANGDPVLDGNGDPITTVTDAAGDYRFDNVEAGTYSVQFEATPGKEFIAQDMGFDDTIDSDVDPSNGITAPITVNPGEETENVDAGVQDIAGSLSGTYFCDEDGDGVDNDGLNTGVAGVVVMLLDAAGDPARDIDGNLVAAVETDDDGNYSFANLAPGTYSVKFTDAVSGGELVAANQGGDDAIDSDAVATGTPGESIIEGITVNADEDTPDNDAGVTGTASVGDRVWVDTNGDGVLNNGEQGQDNVFVRLLADLDGDGEIEADEVVDTTTTQDGGFYAFENLKGGEYAILFEQVDGFDFTTPGDDAADAVDNDSDADQDTGITDVFTLEVGETLTNIDAGLVEEAPANSAPEPMDDEAETCADEEITVDVLGNDGTVVSDPFFGDFVVDADGDVLTITEVDGQSIMEGQTISVGPDGTSVTLSNGQLVIDAGGAFESLGVGETAVQNISYTVSDGNGESATANLEVTFKGAYETFDELESSLPLGTEVSFQIIDENLGVQSDELYTLLMTDAGGDLRLDNVTFTEAYCVGIFEDLLAGEGGTSLADAPLLTGTISLLDDDSVLGSTNPDTMTLADVNSEIDSTELDNMINYILNTDFQSQGFTDAEIQGAIWGITDNFLFVGDGAGTSANAQAILDDVIANGQDFQVGEGDIVAVYIDPTDEAEALGHSQPFIVGITWDDCIC